MSELPRRRVLKPSTPAGMATAAAAPVPLTARGTAASPHRSLNGADRAQWILSSALEASKADGFAAGVAHETAQSDRDTGPDRRRHKALTRDKAPHPLPGLRGGRR